jgi:hypothetical protein
MDMRKKFIDEAIKLIESKYNHLTGKERTDLMIFKGAKKPSPHQYNKLMDLKETVRVKI